MERPSASGRTHDFHAIFARLCAVERQAFAPMVEHVPGGDELARRSPEPGNAMTVWVHERQIQIRVFAPGRFDPEIT